MSVRYSSYVSNRQDASSASIESDAETQGQQPGNEDKAGKSTELQAAWIGSNLTSRTPRKSFRVDEALYHEVMRPKTGGSCRDSRALTRTKTHADWQGKIDCEHPYKG